MKITQLCFYQSTVQLSLCQNTRRHCTDLTAVWVEVWVVCAGLDKTPGETLTGVPGTAGLSWDTDQEDSMTLESEDKHIQLSTNWDTRFIFSVQYIFRVQIINTYVMIHVSNFNKTKTVTEDVHLHYKTLYSISKKMLQVDWSAHWRLQLRWTYRVQQQYHSCLSRIFKVLLSIQAVDSQVDRFNDVFLCLEFYCHSPSIVAACIPKIWFQIKDRRHFHIKDEWNSCGMLTHTVISVYTQKILHFSYNLC